MTFRLFSDRICFPEFFQDLVLKKQAKSLLPTESVDRDALTHTDQTTKPRFTISLSEGLRRFINSCLQISLVGLVFLLSLGLFSFSVLPKISTVYASESISSISFSLPLNGYISTYFSAYHPGVDIASDLGTEIHPVSFGVVESIIYDKYAYGTHVIIAHQNGVKSLYAHLGKVLVQKDQAVYVNTAIGTVGMTGNTSGPHAHIEIINNGSYIDPLAVLPQLKALAPLTSGSATGGNYPTPKKEEPKPTELRKTLKLDIN